MKQLFAAAVLVLAAGAAAVAGPPAAKQLTCPIAHDKVTKLDPKLSSVYKDKTVYFCCEGCKPAFDKKPEAERAKLAAQYGVPTPKPGAAKPTTPAKPAAKKPA